MRPQRTYSPDMQERARQLRQSGLSYMKIARQLGVPSSTVQGWVKEGRQLRKRWTDADDQRLLHWCNRTRKPVLRFCARYGWAHTTVARAMKRLKLRRHGHVVAKDEMETLVQLGASSIVLKNGKIRPAWRVSELQGRITDLRHGHVFTTGEVGAMLSIGTPVVRRWIERGHLKATRTGKQTKAWYLIVHDDLLNALRNEATWPDWQVENITDADWLWAAQQIRKGEW